MPQMPLEINDSEIKIHGHRLSVKWFCHTLNDCGVKKQDRPVVVMLHEGLGCVKMLRDVPEKIARLTGCNVMAYDRLGHGRSDRLPKSHVHNEYILDEACKFLPEVLDQCDLPKAFLWGHSDGGTMALLFAGRFPQRVSGVITEAAHVYVDSLTIQGIKTAVKAWDAGNLREKLANYHGNNVDGIFHRWSTIWLSDTFAQWNIESLLKDITAPVLAFQGADDHYGEPGQLMSITQKTGGRSQRVMIPGCGHIPHLQAFDAVAQKAVGFIQFCCQLSPELKVQVGTL